jgi:hypothetical protein
MHINYGTLTAINPTENKAQQALQRCEIVSNM